MQGHYSKRLKDVPATVSQPESCIADIYVWCGAKCLQVNADKTELQWFGSALQLLSQTSTIHVNHCAIKPVTIVRDLGMWFEVELSMRLQVSREVQTCFSHLRLRRICAVRRQLGRVVTARIITAALFCRIWTTVTPYWLVFQLPHWHHFSESYTPWHVLFWILSCTTT